MSTEKKIMKKVPEKVTIRLFVTLIRIETNSMAKMDAKSIRLKWLNFYPPQLDKLNRPFHSSILFLSKLVENAVIITIKTGNKLHKKKPHCCMTSDNVKKKASVTMEM